MLRPLDDDKLTALLRPDDDTDPYRVSAAKLQLGVYRQLRDGVFDLFDIWPSIFEVRLHHDKIDFEKWHIYFRVCDYLADCFS